MKQKILALLVLAAMVLTLGQSLQAEAAQTDADAKPQEQEATLISTMRSVKSHSGFQDVSVIWDDVLNKSLASKDTASLTLEHSEGIGSLYFFYQYPYEVGYTVTDNATGQSFIAGKYGFLHDFVDLVAMFGYAPSSVTVTYPHGKVHICELRLYSPGTPPADVQRWKPPAEHKADLLLFSTHGDDEQLFFAGVLPYYAKALGYNVQVVYLTDHRNLTTSRVHEMLNGMWSVGCDVYPVFGSFPDFLKETISSAYSEFKAYGYTRSDILDYCTEQLRRFKPKVVVAHDFNGEYSHGQHMVYADCVAEALTAASDPAKMPHSAELYGTWDTPKAYFHLYWENILVMDWDTPMEELDGLSPFQVTQKYGFPCHKSQLWTWFSGWINGKNGVKITKASQIATYSPCLYGLYRSTVGPDVEKKDFFENVTTHAQDDALWLEQNPQLPPNIPPETTGPEPTTPQASQGPEATAPQAYEPPAETRSETSQILLISALVVLSLLVCVLILLLFLRFK